MKRISFLLLAATAFAVPACSNNVASSGGDDGSGGSSGSDGASGSNSGSNSGAPGSNTDDKWQQILNARVVDYSAALKVAAMRLTGNLPTMAEIKQVAGASGDAQRQAYETLLTDYMNRPAFATQMFLFWRDTFKIGGTNNFDGTLDTAPAFAAQLTVKNGSYMDLLTKASANCPTFNLGNGTFTDAECNNGGPKAGVLTNPGVMKQFFSNMAFRRTRWVQETFDCMAFPTEISTTPIDVGGAVPYTGIWPFTSIASTTNGGRINFQDVSSAICANCHQTLNHIAPLFAYYDTNGAYKAGTISVPTPLTGAPAAQMSDYLPTGETTAWRYKVAAADIPALGAAMAADAAVAKCGVARIWNFALGKQDIVDQLVDVPAATIQGQLAAFTQNGFKLKDLVFSVFTSDAFVKF